MTLKNYLFYFYDNLILLTCLWTQVGNVHWCRKLDIHCQFVVKNSQNESQANLSAAIVAVILL